MAYDQSLAQRILALADVPGNLVEKKMFGGWALMLDGNMAVGVINDRLFVRCGQDAYEELLARPEASVFDYSGRVSRGIIVVAPEATTSDATLSAWMQPGFTYAASLPPK